MSNIESRAREYITEHSEYSEVFGQTFVAIDTLTAMVEFSKQETKEISNQINKAKELLQKCLNTYIRNPELKSEIEEFLKEV
jgi:molecular chaperone DnaK (HSP70)